MGAHVSFLDAAADLSAGSAPAMPSVIVPLAAVQANGDAGIVFVITGDRVVRQTVRLGSRNADSQTILAGLQPGSDLAIGDFSKLRDGGRIRIVL